MKANIHPNWYPEATVVCACGNTWKTGATIADMMAAMKADGAPAHTKLTEIVKKVERKELKPAAALLGG